MSIEDLIPTISKLQDIFAKVQSTGPWGGKLEQMSEIELPQIVVVGSQVLFLHTVNALKYGHARIFFNYLFLKKLFNKNAINSHFSFFLAL
jgi:hypothetical protein